MLNKRGKVVSRARSLASQKNIERLKQFQFRKQGEDTVELKEEVKVVKVVRKKNKKVNKNGVSNTSTKQTK